MRRPAPHDPPVALTIAGSDSGGGAGIQADLKTFEAQDVFGTSAVTAVTAQNTRGVEDSHVLPVGQVATQIETVLADFDVRAIKTGMLASAPIVSTVARTLADGDAPLVVDPVIVAESGDRLLEEEAESAYTGLFEQAALVTPNATEAATLTDGAVEDVDDAVRAGRGIVDRGADAVLVTGGHLGDGDRVQDILVRDDGYEVLDHPRVDSDATHGAGCTLSSAVAARLAHGEDIDVAVTSAIDHLERSIRYPLSVGNGPGPVNHTAFLRERADRPKVLEAVWALLEEFLVRDLSPLVPEVGMNVVGATPFAEVTGEVAAIEGRITRTTAGIRDNRGVRFGASSHVARFLLGVREYVPAYRFAVNCRFDDDVESALTALSGPVAEYDRTEQPERVRSGEERTMDWAAEEVFADDGVEPPEEAPVAVIDRGAHGKEPMVKLLGSDPDRLLKHTTTVLESL
jgi:hydroxymethylpyrimidine/phosphomethylpyrimidine kinase